ncbi:MAG: DNA polymerase III subunit delta [Clostridiales bacterium]|nr:DNA polymerase III subunit delta [Clostridiales bacterium]
MSYYNKKRNKGESELAAHLRKEKLKGPYLIFGDDSFLKVYYANEIVKKAVNGQFTDFNLKKIDGTNASIELIRDAVEAVPMFSESTGVLVTDLPINDLSANDFENLLLIIENMPDTCALVFLMQTVESKSSSKKPSNANLRKNSWKDFKAAIEQRGLVFELGHRAASRLVNLLIKGASERGKTLDTNLAHYMVENLGNDINMLRNELDKVCNFAREDKIKKTDIDGVTIKTLEANIFHLADKVLLKESDEAFEILRILLEQRAEPIMIVATLIAPFVDLYRVRAALKAGYSAEDAAKHYDYRNKGFRLTKIRSQAGKLSTQKIVACLDCLDEADEALKSRSFIDEDLVLEKTVAKLISII